ncbi:MAG: hypothetical protein WDO13_05030 [Verrucomicrobiota bacterium]
MADVPLRPTAYPAAFEPSPRDGWGWPLIAAFWLGLFWLGYPLPKADDLWFNGAAFSLADGGPYANPYCPTMAVVGGQEHFFVYVPLYVYVIAGWTELLGRGADTLAAFQCLAGAWSCLGAVAAHAGADHAIVPAPGHLHQRGDFPGQHGAATRFAGPGAAGPRRVDAARHGAIRVGDVQPVPVAVAHRLPELCRVRRGSLRGCAGPRPGGRGTPGDEIALRLGVILGAFAAVAVLFLILIDFQRPSSCA